MTITQCPQCSEKVSVPLSPAAIAKVLEPSSGGHGDSRVRCPLCQAEYLLSEALKKMPPMLILLDEIEEPVAAPDYVPAEEMDASELQLEPVATSSPSFDIASDSIRSSGASATIRATARPKRKPKSPVVEGLKIISGGLAGLIIAQLILWWLPVKLDKQRRDPANLAPKVAPYARFIVPQELWPKSLTDPDGALATNTNKPVAKNGQGGPKNGSADNGGGLGDNVGKQELPNSDFGKLEPDNGDDLLFPKEGSSPKKQPDDIDSAIQPSGDALVGDAAPNLKSKSKPGSPPNTDLPDSDPVEPPKKSTSPDDDPPAKSKPENTDPDDSKPSDPKPEPKPNDPKPAPTKPASELQLLDAPTYAIDDLTTSLEAHAATAEAWSQADGLERDELRKRAAAYYQSFAQVAEVATFVDRKEGGAESIEKLDEVLRSAATNPKQAELIEKIAAGWLVKADRPNNGIVLIGTVKAANDAATLIEVPAKEPRLITVLPFGNSAGKQPAAEGSRVLLLGSVVADPAVHLEGYIGDEPHVVLAAQHFVIPDAKEEKEE